MQPKTNKKYLVAHRKEGSNSTNGLYTSIVKNYDGLLAVVFFVVVFYFTVVIFPGRFLVC